MKCGNCNLLDVLDDLDASAPQTRLAQYHHHHLVNAMSSHFYEVALFGEFFAQDLKPIVNRIMLHSESAQPMHCREFVFEPIDAQYQRENNSEPVLLRARKEVLEPNSKWVLYSYLKPESIRVHPEATVRP